MTTHVVPELTIASVYYDLQCERGRRFDCEADQRERELIDSCSNDDLRIEGLFGHLLVILEQISRIAQTRVTRSK